MSSAAAPAMRVLIAAENASVRFGGEAILPYHYFRLLRWRGVDAHLIVHERCEAELRTLFAHDANRLHFVTDHPLQKLFFKLGRVLPRRVDEATLGLANQMLTQHAQRAVIKRLAHGSALPCLVHQPIPVSPRTPSLLDGLGVPLVVGPLNGGMEYPDGFRAQESLVSRLAIALARSFTDVANALFPGKRLAEIVLVANQRTQSVLPKGLRGRVMHLPENGVDLSQWPRRARTLTDSARFVFIGRLVAWKALDLVLEALVRVPGARLEIIGDGPMHEPWQQRAAELSITDRVRFHGWLSQAECSAQLADACALVLPSLFECGGAVVLEAMAMERPVIATAWGGPLDYLDASCGILVPPHDRASLVEGFAAAMHELAASPERCAAMGHAGRQRVLEHFDWERKIDAMLGVYSSTLTR